jgi:hypothetical protein
VVVNFIELAIEPVGAVLCEGGDHVAKRTHRHGVPAPGEQSPTGVVVGHGPSFDDKTSGELTQVNRAPPHLTEFPGLPGGEGPD